MQHPKLLVSYSGAGRCACSSVWQPQSSAAAALLTPMANLAGFRARSESAGQVKATVEQFLRSKFARKATRSSFLSSQGLPYIEPTLHRSNCGGTARG